MSLISKIFRCPTFCLVPRLSSKTNPSINSSIQRDTQPTNVNIGSTSWPNNQLQLPSRHFSIYKALLNRDSDESAGCRLFVFGIDGDVQREEMEEAFGQCGTVTDSHNTGKGYAFITFSTLTEAQECVSKMNGKIILGQKLDIKMPRVPGSRLFVYGIQGSVQEEDIKEEFSRFGTVAEVFNTGKGYAFISFSSSSEAQDCMSSLDGKDIFGQTLSIKIATGKGGGGDGGISGGGGRYGNRGGDQDDEYGGGNRGGDRYGGGSRGGDRYGGGGGGRNRDRDGGWE